MTQRPATGRPMLSGREVRARLQIGRDKFLELVRTGQLAAIRTGTAPNSPYRVSPDALDDYIERNRVAPGRAAL